jgi:hypothetical protein
MKPRKLILSRKGFDSKAGGCPSPIFPEGTFYSLPIPIDGASITYGDLDHGGINIGQVVDDLTRGRLDAQDGVHLDPDIRQGAIRRHNAWRGMLGQTGAPEGHLEKQAVGAGDVFLFFGLFRRVEETREGWRFVRGEPQQHILWGWLQIEQVCKVDEIRYDRRFDWARYHCHFGWRGDPGNTLYVTTHQVDLGDNLTASGAGVFPRFDERLVLTKPGGSVSQWRLPRWFYPDGRRTPLTYHPDATRWQHNDDFAYLQSVGRGQEFVLDLQDYPEAMDWISGMVHDFGAN